MKSQRTAKSSTVAERIPSSASCLDIDDFQRHDLVGLAAVDDEAHRLAGDKGAVRLVLGVERIAAGGARGLAGLGGAPAFEVEDMLVGERGGDDLNQLARRRREPAEPSNPAAIGAAVAEDLELHDVPS